MSKNLEMAHRFQLLVNSIVDYAIYMIDPDGVIQSWNAGAERLKGYTASEIIGQPFSRFFTPEDLARGVPQQALKVAEKVGRYESEGWRLRKDGTRFWALAVIDAIRENDGTLLGFAKITRDMTEREIARRELVESEERFRQLVNSVIDYAIFQLDRNGIVATWNTGAQRIKGYAAEEIIGQHFSRFYTEEDRRDGVPERALETAAREGRYEAEGVRLRKDGTEFSALVVIDPIKDATGEVIGFAKVTRDVTERVLAQKLLAETQEQLAASQKMDAVGQLTGGIAHDFNNLMMIILGNLENADRQIKSHGASNPNLQRTIANAMRGAQRAAALTSRLLAFSRRQPLNPRALELNKFLVTSGDFLQRSLGETVQVEVVGSPGLWQVEIDANQLETALVNLALNARDAMPSGGKITLEATNIFADEVYCRTNPELSPGQYVLLCVSDSGSGMSPDVASRAFEPFFTTKEPGHGTGLGLSQVYGFIKQSGGHVKIYSEFGHGTTIKIYLPRHVGRSEDAEEMEQENAPSRSEAGETILVVEDDADLRAYLAEILRGLGYRVMIAPHAKGALAILEQKSNRIDLLLTDVVMPGMNGRDLGLRAQDIRPGLRVLHMTGYSRSAVVHQGRLDEGVDLLQKPIAQSNLAFRVRDLLDRPSDVGRDRNN